MSLKKTPTKPTTFLEFFKLLIKITVLCCAEVKQEEFCETDGL